MWYFSSKSRPQGKIDHHFYVIRTSSQNVDDDDDDNDDGGHNDDDDDEEEEEGEKDDDDKVIYISCNNTFVHINIFLCITAELRQINIFLPH